MRIGFEPDGGTGDGAEFGAVHRTGQHAAEEKLMNLLRQMQPFAEWSAEVLHRQREGCEPARSDLPAALRQDLGPAAHDDAEVLPSEVTVSLVSACSFSHAERKGCPVRSTNVPATRYVGAVERTSSSSSRKLASIVNSRARLPSPPW